MRSRLSFPLILVALLLGLALGSVGTDLARGQDGTPTAAAPEEHDAVVRLYDDTKRLLDEAGGRVTDDTRATYDDLRRRFDAIGGELEAAKGLAGDEAVRAYRDIQHELELMDHDIDSALHAVGHADDSVWHDIRDGVASVAQSIDHVTDRLLRR